MLEEIEIFKPTLDYVEQIYSLIEYFARKGDILIRSRENVAERIREFFCAKDKGRIVGVSSLRVYYPYLAEIRTLAIDEDYQNKRIGSFLVDACLEEAKSLRVREVFALTFKKEFFLKIGFRLIDKKQLPSKKIWEDCISCPLFPNCNEEAVLLSLK